MRKVYIVTVIILLFFSFSFNLQAQIYEPEGLNMPGSWNSWTNPPTNNLAFASSTQVTNGRIVKFTNGANRWQTILQVAATGGDVVAGTYTWLFTSGAEATPFQNKWGSVNVTVDQLQMYSYQGAGDNEVVLQNGYWYTVVWEDIAYVDSRAIFMQTSAEPVEISSVSEPNDVAENEIVDVDFTLAASPSPEEVFYLQYTNDGWSSAHIISAVMTGTSGTASIPGQAESSVVEYNVFSSTVAGLSSDGFLHAIHMNDDGGLNYDYTVGASLPDTIGWANLQWPASGEIIPEAEYTVYGQAYIYNITEQSDSLVDLEAWVGYSTTNTDPSTWTNWLPAYYFGEVGNNDEYSVNLGSFMDTEGTYYYATRFKYLDQDYVYGGFSDGGGDFWDGVDYISGVLTVTSDPSPAVIGWANLQWPADGEIEPENEFIVFGQAWIDEYTNQADSLITLQAWVGYSTSNTDPSTWTNWSPAYYLGADGDNDEYSFNLGAIMDQEGTYYYATRFKYLDQDYVYGGYSDGGGNFWDGVDFISGVLTVLEDPTPPVIGWANLNWPPSGEILPEDDFIVYGQAWIDELTAQSDSLIDLQSWVGYSLNNTNPNTWTNWIPAYYLSGDGDNDEYSSNLGANMDEIGTYYYSTRFQYLDQDYVYGGYSVDGGGFWDGTTYGSGILTVTSEPAPDTIGWANLQWPANGNIELGEGFSVFGQAWIDGVTGTGSTTADLEAWIGFSENDTEPSSWTNWIVADFESAVDGKDQFNAEIGAAIVTEGTYYYATRFKYPNQEYVYGGYSASGGDFWDGVDYVSGELTVTIPLPDTISWANIQWPPTGEILPEEEFVVYGQAWIDNLTNHSDTLVDLEAWIGYHTDNTDPATWTNWIPAYYFGEDGDNDEYSADLGAMMSELGTYYYATRFKYPEQEYVYGGYSDAGGDFWDGVDNINGVLTVTTVPAPDTIGWANLQWPPTGAIEPEQEFNVFAQAWIDGITGSGTTTDDLEAWIGYSENNTDPATWTNWIIATYEGADGVNDEFIADIGTEMLSEGTFYYATRFKYPEQEFVYGGYSDNGGGFWNGSDYVNGVLTVSEALVAYPVDFTVTDATGLYSNIKFKGDMTSWDPEDMIQDGQDWNLSLDIFPGTYEWGVLEDDASPEGIWLVIGDNLVVSIDNEGVISGETTYVITFVGVNDLSNEIAIYPNPVNDLLWIEKLSEGQIEIQLLDATGNLVETMRYSSSKIKLDLSHLAAGIYFMQLKEGNQVQMLKFIKQ